MASDDLIDVEGVVDEVCPAGMFKIKTDNGMMVLAHLSGKMRKNKIRVVLGDRVTIAVTPYDLTKGRLTYRHK